MIGNVQNTECLLECLEKAIFDADPLHDSNNEALLLAYGLIKVLNGRGDQKLTKAVAEYAEKSDGGFEVDAAASRRVARLIMEGKHVG